MQINPKTLRRALLALAVVLVASVAGVIGYSRWKARHIWDEIQARLKNARGKPFCVDCSYAPNIHGRVPFRLHAKRGEEIGPGKFALHDARVTLYSADGKHQDYIYGAEFEYDQKNEVVRALGEVQMDLEAPETLSRKPASGDPGKAAANPIHVRTSELVYKRKLDIAATDKPVEIHYGEIVCNAVGADFDNRAGLVRLLREVHITGALKGQQGTLDASHASMNRSTNQLEFNDPRSVSGDRRGRAAHALVYLRKDGSIDHGEADGAVELSSAVSGGSRDVHAQRLELTANSDNVVQTARLFGGVTLVGTEPGRPMNGHAETADLRFNSAGRLQDLLAAGHAALHTEALAGARITRDISGDRIHAAFNSPGGPKAPAILTAMEALGAASARFDEPVNAPNKPAGQRRYTEIHADNLQTAYAPEASGSRATASLRQLKAQGHTVLDQRDTTGAHTSSSGDALEASFVSGDGGRGSELLSATQTGHVRLASLAAPKPVAADKPGRAPAEWKGTASRASFDGATEVLTLTADAGPSAQVTDGSTEIVAQEVRLHRLTGDGEASGRVSATLWNDPADTAARPGERPATHVEADRARLLHSVNQAEFFGSAAHPARLWQRASQVIAAHLSLDGVRKTLAARPEGPSDWVRADFAESDSGVARPANAHTAMVADASRKTSTRIPEVRPAAAPAAGSVRVVSARMDYSDASREAIFGGGPGGKVHMELPGGESLADRGTVFLSPAKPSEAATPGASSLGSSLDRAVLQGHVDLHQPDRTGTAEQLTYIAAGERYVLTGAAGHPPHVADERQGNVTGATLVFSHADSSIVVAGEPGAEKGRNGRVRTELELKP